VQLKNLPIPVIMIEASFLSEKNVVIRF